jgi:hypothetical protein
LAVAGWLALRNIAANWGKATHHRKEAINQFAILYAERFTREACYDYRSDRNTSWTRSFALASAVVLSPVKLWVLARSGQNSSQPAKPALPNTSAR